MANRRTTVQNVWLMVLAIVALIVGIVFEILDWFTKGSVAMWIGAGFIAVGVVLMTVAGRQTTKRRPGSGASQT